MVWRIIFLGLYVCSIGRAESVDFSRDIRPILSDNCFQCHGPDENAREADLRLDQKSLVLADRNGAKIIDPGNVGASELIDRISTKDPDLVMPPPDSGKSLTDNQKALLTRWIKEGAAWDEHWSFKIPQRPAVPRLPATLHEWRRNEIDDFVGRKLDAESLRPEPEADRRVLIRRLYLDLLGLPPNREQVRTFLNDDRFNAYEQLVDELLESPHFGERMTVAWLDQSRYADTNGYSIDGGRHMWLWRDWLIHAYNENMPFDQFIIEQIAGDLLPDATIDQKVATAFNRNHMITHEGGTIPEENLVNYAADRVRTTAEVFMGLTMGCAQCHDHKYDPISQRDYYRFFAYFNSIGDRGLDGDGGRNATPKLTATSVLHRDSDELDRIRYELEEWKRRLTTVSPDLISNWENNLRQEMKQLGKDLQLHPVKVIKVTSPNRGSAYTVLDDGTVYVPNGRGRSPSISVRFDQEQVTGVRIVFSPDDRVKGGRLGHGGKPGFEGSFLLTSFSISNTDVESDQVDLYRTLPIDQATASFSHPRHPPGDCLDPRDFNGWSPGDQVDREQHVTFRFKTPISASESPYLTAMLVWGGGHGLVAGKYRMYVLTGHDDDTNIPSDIQEIVVIPDTNRTSEQQRRFEEYYTRVAPELANIRYQIQNLEERLDHLTKASEVMVMNVAAKPRQTFILNRGQYDQPTTPVDVGTPSSLPPLPADAPATRLGLARWLASAQHPLTARVAVNRIWQMLFGTGIVETSADFGSQGTPPTHPELLDWMATEFVKSGWNVKSLLKEIVLSATYRQSSNISPQKLAADPRNRLMSRGPRFRLQAEFVRDAGLKISGLLSKRIGGPSVRPYQPPNLWKEVSHFGSTPATSQAFVQDHGEKLYRRSMYTYWKRTVPPPSMISFDAPSREICTVRRSRTNTPLQALVLLNDPQFVEASRAFAQRIISNSNDATERIEFAFEEALARLPNKREIEIASACMNDEYERFRRTPNAAQSYLRVGETARDESIDPIEHAAWTTVASLILNLSESITKN